MKLEEFNYHLPKELIAQEPCKVREQARMMVVHRKTGLIEDKGFYNLPEFLDKGDVLVINDSKVIPARLIGKKASGGEIKILLLRRHNDTGQIWEVLLRPAKRLQAGGQIWFNEGCWATIINRISDRKWLLAFRTDIPFDQFLHQYGKAPLPPYIKRRGDYTTDREDIERYQTVYARVPGSVAAPTAGLHFSESLLDTLKDQGIQVVTVTLHCGYGTFLPIETELVEEHTMEEEFFEIGEEAAERINTARRVVAVGTTSTRVIESASDGQGRTRPSAGFTRLFIYPGYHFKRVNALITNFHLPKSSLFLLVCAFAGKNLMQVAYQQAIDDHYRFYSYGDCMLIL